jgi:hypothetical protein
MEAIDYVNFKLFPESITLTSATLLSSEAHLEEITLMENCLKHKPLISFYILTIILASRAIVLVFQGIHLDELNFDLYHESTLRN